MNHPLVWYELLTVLLGTCTLFLAYRILRRHPKPNLNYTLIFLELHQARGLQEGDPISFKDPSGKDMTGVIERIYPMEKNPNSVTLLVGTE